MAVETLPPPDVLEEEEGGGPVKPFLEHLEDLRWTIIKVLGAVVISMIVCLVASDRLFEVLRWPLLEAQRLRAATTTNQVALFVGNVRVGDLPLAGVDTNLWHSGVPPTAVRILFTLSGTNVAYSVASETNLLGEPKDPGLVTIKAYGPLSAITVALKIALYGGLSLASPFVMLFIGQFVLPALRTHEKRFVYRALGIGLGLFLVGVIFAYFVIMQITLLATVQFAQWLGLGADEWRADEYVDFVLKMILAVGLSFQLPVVLLTLVKIGILDYEKLTNYRSYFIVGNMVACALITPSGDPFTMLMLAVPVQGLYEISVFIARVWWRREQRELAAAEAADSG
jgi:sec-independent protein translocase protein TatC